MSRVLIICNTYFQLIAAMQLKVTLFADDEVDVGLSDHSRGSELVYENISCTGLFANVLYLETKKRFATPTAAGKMRNGLEALTGRCVPPTRKAYDHVLFHNWTLDLCSMVDLCEAEGREVEWSRFEEGLLSYSTDDISLWGRSVGIADRRHRLASGLSYASSIKNYYCFFPELKVGNEGGANLMRIPPISQDQALISSYLKEAFAIDAFECEQKYIYLASSDDMGDKAFGETELVLQIAQLVGPQNLLVKMHPRDTRTVYQDAGIAVMENSYVPWEVMQLIGDVAGKTLITSVSGSFISVSAMMQPAPRSLFVFAPVEGNEWYRARTAYIADVVERLHAQGLCPNIQAIPLSSLEEELGREPEPAKA